MSDPDHGSASGTGDRPVGEALDELVPLLYDDLRRLAAAVMRGERPDHTLQPTALAHEAYLRLAAQKGCRWHSRHQVLAVAARVMRRALVDHARARLAAKRGGAAVRVTLTEAEARSGPDVDLLALDLALERLAESDPRAVTIVELRYFAGFSVDEVAEALGLSRATVKRDWALARAWLTRELGPRRDG